MNLLMMKHSSFFYNEAGIIMCDLFVFDWMLSKRMKPMTLKDDL